MDIVADALMEPLATSGTPTEADTPTCLQRQPRPFNTFDISEAILGVSPLSESGRLPSPTDAENQPLDSSARKSLIYKEDS